MQRHPLDIMSLLFGAIFLMIGLAGLAEASWFDLRLELAVPIIVIVLGLGVLASTRRPKDPSVDAEEPTGLVP